MNKVLTMKQFQGHSVPSSLVIFGLAIPQQLDTTASPLSFFASDTDDEDEFSFRPSFSVNTFASSGDDEDDEAVLIVLIIFVLLFQSKLPNSEPFANDLSTTASVEMQRPQFLPPPFMIRLLVTNHATLRFIFFFVFYLQKKERLRVSSTLNSRS